MKILMTGGGTGGHIYPAMAFIKYVQKINPEAEFLYIGTEKGLESKIVPTYNIPFKTINIQGFKRSLSLDNFKTVYLFLASVKSAKKILQEFSPDIVIGTGGYVCGSVVYAAAKMNIPTIIHEQNSVPGITNKFLSRYATKIAICFSDVANQFPKNKVVVTGNPRAQEVASLQKSDILEEFDLSPNKKTVVIFGGSRGALKINQAVIEAFESFKHKPYQVLYASGETYFSLLQSSLDLSSKSSMNISVQPYIDKMAEVLASVDLVVSRAGATSIAEFTALGLPAVLVPSPYVTNDHQTKNAQSLAKLKAVSMVADSELTGEILVQKIDEILLDEEKQKIMTRASRQQGIPDASERLYRLVEEIT